MEIKELFEKGENGTLTYEQFKTLAKENKANFTDLSEGKYVSKNKYDDDLKAKDEAIATLNSTIATRDSDLTDLKDKLEKAGTDSTKLQELTGNLEALQGKYDADTKAYEEKLTKQAYEFAVKEFANSKQFTSEAAKRDFTRSMISENLKMKDSMILGAEDFAKNYADNNSDAFKKAEEPPKEPEKPQPQFVSSTQGSEPSVDKTGGFANAFHFTGVRPKE